MITIASVKTKSPQRVRRLRVCLLVHRMPLLSPSCSSVCLRNSKMARIIRSISVTKATAVPLPTSLLPERIAIGQDDQVFGGVDGPPPVSKKGVSKSFTLQIVIRIHSTIDRSLRWGKVI